jgi:hypothetical protein
MAKDSKVTFPVEGYHHLQDEATPSHMGSKQHTGHGAHPMTSAKGSNEGLGSKGMHQGKDSMAHKAI